MFRDFGILLGTLAFVFSPRGEAQPPSFPLPVAEISRSIENIVRESSQNNNRPSMALIDRETARSMSYDNQLKHTRTYFENRKLNRSYRAAERGPRQTSTQISRRAKEAAPDRLTVNQYDQVGGRMNWPIVLKADNYATERTKLDGLFPLHANQGGGINTAHYANIQTTIQDMQSALKANRTATNVDQYIYALRFLESLSYEARVPVGS